MRSRSLRLFGGSFGTARLKLFHAAGGVEDLLVAAVKRVACRADFYLELFLGRADGKGPPTRTGRFCTGKIVRMGLGFHTNTLT